MKRLFRFAMIFGTGLIVVLCGGALLFNRNAPRITPTARPVVVVESDPTSAPVAARPTAVPRGYIGQDTIGDAWPLTIPSGTIVCDRNAILLRAPDDRLYAVNGTALGQAKSKGWADIRDLSIPTPNDGAGTIKSLQPLLDLGLQLCPQR